LTEHAKVLILGAGPSGYAAAVHAARANLRPLLIAASINHLENSAAHTSWPSDIDVVIGPVMKERLRDHAERASTRMIVDNIASVDLSVRPCLLRGHKSNYSCDALIIAVDCLADTNLFSGQLDTHADRIITRIGLSGAHTLSSQRGVFIAGDVGAPQYSEVITSVGTGGLAVLDARRFLGH
jgi:thioredoxin reductase